jgi:hypothetical protein
VVGIVAVEWTVTWTTSDCVSSGLKVTDDGSMVAGAFPSCVTCAAVIVENGVAVGGFGTCTVSPHAVSPTTARVAAQAGPMSLSSRRMAAS